MWRTLHSRRSFHPGSWRMQNPIKRKRNIKNVQIPRTASTAKRRWLQEDRVRGLEALTALVVFLFLLGRHRRGNIVRQTLLDLGLDLRQVFRLRFQVAGMRPLELGLQRTTNAPIGVAK